MNKVLEWNQWYYNSGTVATTGNWDSVLCTIYNIPKGNYLLVGIHANTGTETPTVIWFAYNIGSAIGSDIGVQRRYTPFWGGGFSTTEFVSLSTTKHICFCIKTPNANTNSSGSLYAVRLRY